MRIATKKLPEEATSSNDPIELVESSIRSATLGDSYFGSGIIIPWLNSAEIVAGINEFALLKTSKLLILNSSRSFLLAVDTFCGLSNIIFRII